MNTKLLFVCSQNKLRSLTAERFFSEHEGFDVASCGTNKDAATTISGDLIEWADHIFVMEDIHKKKMTKKFRDLLRDKRIRVLGIPDDYDFMDEELIEILKNKIRRYIEFL
jgi:predicted protein tyrosine phosphatase